MKKYIPILLAVAVILSIFLTGGNEIEETLLFTGVIVEKANDSNYYTLAYVAPQGEDINEKYLSVNADDFEQALEKIYESEGKITNAGSVKYLVISSLYSEKESFEIINSITDDYRTMPKIKVLEAETNSISNYIIKENLSSDDILQKYKEAQTMVDVINDGEIVCKIKQE